MKIYNTDYYTGLGDELATEVIGSREAHPTLKEMQEAVEVRRKRIAQIKDLLPEKEEKLASLKEERDALLAEAENLREAIPSAKGDKEALADIASQVEDIEVKGKEVEEEIIEISKAISSLKQELESLEAEEAKYLEDQEKPEAKKKKLQKQAARKGRKSKKGDKPDKDNKPDDKTDDKPKDNKTEPSKASQRLIEILDENDDDDDDDDDDMLMEDELAAGISVEKRPDVTAIVCKDNKISETEEEEDMAASIDLAQVTKALKDDEVAVALAQVQATNGKVVPAVLKPFVQMIISNNKEVRESIAVGYESIMREFPELLDGYRSIVNDLSKDHRMKYMIKCPVNGKLYESEDQAYVDLDKDDILALHKGLWSFEDAWIKLDENGDAIAILEKIEVISKIKSLPREIQEQAYAELHIKKDEEV